MSTDNLRFLIQLDTQIQLKTHRDRKRWIETVGKNLVKPLMRPFFPVGLAKDLISVRPMSAEDMPVAISYGLSFQYQPNALWDCEKNGPFPPFPSAEEIVSVCPMGAEIKKENFSCKPENVQIDCDKTKGDL